MRILVLLFCATVSIAYSRPGETSGQMQQRFGAPQAEEGSIQRAVSPPEFILSGHMTSRIHRFGEIEIVVYFYDNKSQREEFRKKTGTGFEERIGKLEKAEIDQILNGANNGAPWTVESDTEGETLGESTKQRILERGLTEFDRACYKSKGLRAWFENDASGRKRLVVETEAFRALRLANKPEAQKTAPPKGKGF